MVMGTVFAIKRYAIHDGPNIRTTVFLKGCPLSCQWCHNPEGMAKEVVMLWNKEKCVGCGVCVDDCEEKSLSRGKGDLLRDETRCHLCGNCTEICPAMAHESIGWQATVAEIIGEIEKDIPFYDQSGGGVTFSGGEPLLQHEFLLELLKKCGELGIHRAVDTSAYVETPMLLEVAEQTDLFLIDLKHMDSKVHQLYTGVPNELILKNIEELAQRGIPITIRIPLIEGVNSDDNNIHASADFLSSLSNINVVDLLPYHDIGSGKYAKLGWQEKRIEFMPMTTARVDQCTRILTEKNLKVQVGG